ncbi:MAG: adenosylcobinamide-GDP ribazoletransferase [Pseudomonadota bacterium]
MLATALAFTLVAQRQIGGQTGDVLGATQKLSECAGWLIVAALS